MDKKITKGVASKILDSRGVPTLEVEVFAGSKSVKFSVSGGASKGSHEPIDKRDEDFSAFRQLREEAKIYVAGDDLTVTNKRRLAMAIDAKSINSVIIKPNQIGALTETLETMEMARENNIEWVVSHRSGETNDDFISDLAWAFGTFGLKAGAATAR
jgi:enolase